MRKKEEAEEYFSNYCILEKIAMKFYRSDNKADPAYKVFKCSIPDCKFQIKQEIWGEHIKFFNNQLSHDHKSDLILIQGNKPNFLSLLIFRYKTKNK